MERGLRERGLISGFIRRRLIHCVLRDISKFKFKLERGTHRASSEKDLRFSCILQRSFIHCLGFYKRVVPYWKLEYE
jgi:hypothetical protein